MARKKKNKKATAARRQAKSRRRARRKQLKRQRQARFDPLQRASTWPLHECLATPQWQEEGLVTIVVSRIRPDGGIAVGALLVDLYCLGIKDADVHEDLDRHDYQRLLRRVGGEDRLQPCAPALAARIARAGVEYASSLGFAPAPGWERAMLVLGDPDPDSCVQEVQCGHDGKPLYIAGPHDDSAAIIRHLEKRVGSQGFHFISPADGDTKDALELESLLAELSRSTAAGLEERLDRCATLKRCLVLWAASPAMADERARFRCERDDDGDTSAEDLLERFLAHHRLEDGRSLHRAFAAWADELHDGDRAIVLGWEDRVESVFEVKQHRGDHLVATNLVDDLSYRIRSNMGSDALRQVSPGHFLVGAVVPLGDEWLLSGTHDLLPPSVRQHVLQGAARLAHQDPRAFFRNPAHLERGWELQRENYETFVEHFGSSELMLPGSELQATMNAFMAESQSRARRRVKGSGVLVKQLREAPAPSMPLPESLLHEEDVGVLHHPRWGLGFYSNYRSLRAACQDPETALDRGEADILLHFLEARDIDPLPLLFLGEQYPQGVSRLFAVLLDEPGFSWKRNGEALLRSYKQSHWDLLLPRTLPLNDELARAAMSMHS